MPERIIGPWLYVREKAMSIVRVSDPRDSTGRAMIALMNA